MNIAAGVIRAAQQGDPEAIHSLITDATSIVAGILSALRASGVCGRGIDVDDLRQEILLHVLYGLPFLRAEDGGQFVAWLRRIVSARICDEYRRMSRTSKQPGRTHLDSRLRDSVSRLEELTDTEPSPPDFSALEETRAVVRRGVLRLPELQRRAVELRWLEGRSHSEIAHALALPSIAAAESLARRGLARLRQWLGSRDL